MTVLKPVRLRLAVVLVVSLHSMSCNTRDVEQTNYMQVDRVPNAGSIEGTVLYRGAIPPAEPIDAFKDREVCGATHPNTAAPGAGPGIRGAMVYLESIDGGKPFVHYPAPRITIKGCEYWPHVQLTHLGDTLTLTNQDATDHGSHFTHDGKPMGLLDLNGVGESDQLKLLHAGMYIASCDDHPWMKAYVMVVDNPYYAVTDSLGRFSLADVPPGTYRLKVWRDSWVLTQTRGQDDKVVSYDWGGDMRDEQVVQVKANTPSTVQFQLQQ